jgi:Protein of unknown function (DUF3562)
MIAQHVSDHADDETTSIAISEMIATETHRPFDEVKHVFDDEFARLKASARVTDYLVLFATRRTRDSLARSR